MRRRPNYALLLLLSTAIAPGCGDDELLAPAPPTTSNVLPVSATGLERLEGLRSGDREGAEAAGSAEGAGSAGSAEGAGSAGSAGPAMVPLITIARPLPGFHVAPTFLAAQAGGPTTAPPWPVSVRGQIQVDPRVASTPPIVAIPQAPGVAVTVVRDANGCGGNPVGCWAFTASVPVAYGNVFLGAMTTDGLGGVSDTRVTGFAEYCRRLGHDAGVPSRNGLQNNRCHEIDGCSVPTDALARDSLARNDPMKWALNNQYNVASTGFGQGSDPPKEFFAHGLSPADNLPCNNHDVCYQTPGTVKQACDDQMMREMVAVCARAYPAWARNVHPRYGSMGPVRQRQFDNESQQCLTWAGRWRKGLNTRRAVNKFNQRQNQYRLN